MVATGAATGLGRASALAFAREGARVIASHRCQADEVGELIDAALGLDGGTLSAQIRDRLRELSRHGVSRMLVIDGHDENQRFLTEGIDLGLRELETRGRSMRVLRCEYWDYTPRDVLDRVFENGLPGCHLEHAAPIETPMMLFLHPDRARTDRIPKDDRGRFAHPDVHPQDGTGVPESGVLAPARAASAETGRWLIEGVASATVSALADFCAGEDRFAARDRPRSARDRLGTPIRGARPWEGPRGPPDLSHERVVTMSRRPVGWWRCRRECPTLVRGAPCPPHSLT